MHLWRGVLACLVVLAAAGSSVAPVAGRTTRDARVIIGYVFPHGRVLAAGEIDATNLTHVNYAFANVVGGEVVEGSPLDAENFRVLAGLRRVHPHLRVLVSVGGWTWSKGFSDAALTADSRRRFVDSAVAFVRRHALDGVDIDWEYPALPGDSNPHRPEDTANFTQLMAALRASLDAEGVASSRQLLLTMAAGAFPAFLAHADMDAVQRTVDFVNLMTYDFRVQSADRTTGHHANLRPHPDDDKQLSVERAVRDFRTAGVPAAKIVIGVPFYGRAWEQVTVTRHGLYQPGQPLAMPLDLSPAGIDALLASDHAWLRRWDKRAQAPYLWHPDRHIFASVEDERSVRLKARYARQQGLGGVMFWEYFGDPSGRLLAAMADEMR
jgi:chitinase